MPVPDTPIIYTPKDNDSGVDRNLWIVTSEYTSGGAEPFIESDWQVATDEFFTNIVWEDSASDAEWINQVSTDSINYQSNLMYNHGLGFGESYWVRVRWKNMHGYSDWSVPVNFAVLVGTNFVRYVTGGASPPLVAITTDEKFFENGTDIRDSVYFRNKLQGWYTTDMHDTAEPHITRYGNIFSQHVFRIPDNDPLSAIYSYLDWTPEDTSYGVLVILWIRASTDTTATVAITNNQAAFDPADTLVLRKVNISDSLRRYVFYYPRVPSLFESDQRRLWVWPTEVDDISQEATVDIAKVIVRDVIEDVQLPQPISYILKFDKQQDSRYNILDGSEKNYIDGFSFDINIQYDLLSALNTIGLRKIYNASNIFMFPHPDTLWCNGVVFNSDFLKAYFSNKVIYGYGGKLVVKSKENFPDLDYTTVEV